MSLGGKWKFLAKLGDDSYKIVMEKWDPYLNTQKWIVWKWHLFQKKNNKNYMEADWVVTPKRPFQWFWPSENEIRLPSEAVGTPLMDLSALTI